jgi:hypothetical protein
MAKRKKQSSKVQKKKGATARRKAKKAAGKATLKIPNTSQQSPGR